MTGIDGCLAEAMTVPGARGASLVDWSSGLALGAAGHGPDSDHETAAAGAAELARLAFENGAFTGATPDSGPVEDLVVTARGSYHLMRFVETSFDSSVFLYLWLDRTEANLAVALFRLKDLTARLVLP
ncbi:hypothetical protein BLA24_11410 [Streptomyces cinnamoneus]|uniref:Roadblock/LAMTOR2 domain-containing protein n=1 Tax=Streptomyces cinnamoneus TaxID=53446 RepID=A0A2G1XKC7_STRCJ|nr:hypothetical protein [Streptomyces cinnamoneus]PHQ51693.1 hypothetical protein BLA24_11410 [Streptomyces cinnamoneus]PPT11942.1 hypothetical protein CYQ11_02645 [Streptomyces cinnamoneus]